MTPPRNQLYLAPLDGLRFLAFLAVFFHHMPKFAPSLVLTTANAYGWVGVELFFMISSFLFFHLLDAEYEKTGRISTAKFFARRFLRIYPLMILFPLAMLAIYGTPDGSGFLRLAGLALFLDNAATWFKGYNLSIPNTAHLWTLSFEFQIYALIPFVFMAYRRIGKAAFLAALAAVFIYSFAARATVYGLGAAHPIIWVTPFLRPESVLMGMALYLVRPRWHWALSAVGAVIFGAAFLSLPPPWTSPLASAFSYPFAALMFGGLVDAGLRSPMLASVLSSAPFRYLGRISYGLYVYHFLFIAYAVGQVMRWQGRAVDPSNIAGDYWLLWLTALTLTVAMATASYFGLELWISRYKGRFAAVEGRPDYAVSLTTAPPSSISSTGPQTLGP